MKTRTYETEAMRVCRKLLNNQGVTAPEFETFKQSLQILETLGFHLQGPDFTRYSSQSDFGDGI